MLDRSISSSLGCYLGIFLQLVPGPCFLYPYGHVPWHRVKLYGFTDPCHGRHCLRSHICLFSTFIPFKLHIVLTNLIASISFTVLTRKRRHAMNDFWESFRLANSYTIPMQWVPSLPWPLPRSCPASFLWYCSKPAHFPFDLPSGSILSRLPFWDFGFP